MRNINLKKTTFQDVWKRFGALIALILTIGGIIQFYEYIEKYFPNVNIWLDRNKVVLLVIAVLLLIIALIIVSHFYSKLLKIHTNENLQMNTNKIVLFLSPSSGGGGDFYQEHFSHLVKSAVKASKSTLNIQLSLISPHKDFQNEDPELLLELIKNYPAKVSGIFMIPSQPDADENFNGLLEIKKNFPALVLIDVFPLTSKTINNEKFNFIGGNELEGGHLAGSLGKNWLTKQSIKTQYKILILKGRSTAWEMQRINAFKESICSTEDGSGVKFIFDETEDLHYESDKAKKELKTRFTKGQNISTYDIIFSCNDEMAIGAIEVLSSFVREKKYKDAQLPKVIGYDGTPEMKRLIESCNQFILGTIDVDIEEQADLAIKTMGALLMNPKSIQKELNLLKPSIIANSLFF